MSALPKIRITGDNPQLHCSFIRVYSRSFAANLPLDGAYHARSCELRGGAAVGGTARTGGSRHRREDVLLAVQAVGVCGSDLHQYHGKHSWKVNYPVALGHEFAGVIAQTGRGRDTASRQATASSAKRRRCSTPHSPFARAGQYNLDPNRLGFGYGVSGAMTNFVRVPQRCLHHLPDSLPIEKAALTEPCCVAYNATCVNTHIRPGDAVAVIGPGPIGLLCAMMAKLSGANPLLVIGIPADAARLEVAKQTGRDPTRWERRAKT